MTTLQFLMFFLSGLAVSLAGGRYANLPALVLETNKVPRILSNIGMVIGTGLGILLSLKMNAQDGWRHNVLPVLILTIVGGIAGYFLARMKFMKYFVYIS